MKEKKIQLKEGQKFLINIGISFFQAFILLFIGLTISFFIYFFILRTPHLNRIPFTLDPGEYALFLDEIGYNDPILIQFQNYLINFFTGNWGESYIVQSGMPVTELMRTITPRTIEIMLLPLIIGLGGIKLGKIWANKKDKIIGKILTFVFTIGLAMPIFFLGPMMQTLFGNYTEIPVMFRKSPALPYPPNITGFEIFDSIISGSWDLVNDYILHSIVPWLVLTLSITPLILKQTRTRIENDSKNNSIVSNSFNAGKLFGFLFMIIFIIELSFNLTGFNFWFINSIFQGDSLVINGFILMVIISFVFTIFFANIISIIFKFLKKKISKEQLQPEMGENENLVQERGKTILFKVELKNYIKSSVRNPFTIIAVCLILILVILSLVHPLLGTYPLEEVIPPYIPGESPYLPPSPTHPLGTTRYGYDLLARVLYGTREALVFGIIAVLIGLAGGSIFGFLAGKFHRYVYNGFVGSMIIFFLFPGFLVVILVWIFFPFNYLSFMVLIGILLIPIFTRIIANAIRREYSYFDITKAIIKYIPLEMAFAILLYQGLGFIGLSDWQSAQLGETLYWGVLSFSATWTRFWPGIFIFFITLGLILLHEGLKAPASSRTLAD